MLCYDYIRAQNPAAGPPIVYLPGLVHPKNEGKSISLQSWCKKNDYSFLCADYYGVGRSAGKFEDGTISRWVADSIALLDRVLVRMPQHRGAVLVGHGVGTWISFLLAAKRPDLVRGLVGMSSDPDFTVRVVYCIDIFYGYTALFHCIHMLLYLPHRSCVFVGGAAVETSARGCEARDHGAGVR
jgi:pimeloyl-ACP methyl ester carboxylesterase